MKGKYLITTDNWFYAPDGLKYKAAWGEISVQSDTMILGIETNRNSTNWYLVVGSDDKGVSIAGCQIHYAVSCPNRPPEGMVMETMYDITGAKTIYRPSEIYIAE